VASAKVRFINALNNNYYYYNNYITNIGSINKFKSELKLYLQQNWTLE